MFWGLEKPNRLQRERAEIEALAGEVTWLTSKRWGFDAEWHFTVDVEIIVNDVSYEVVLVYPHLFPDTPAFIRPRVTDTAIRWSVHQYGAGGALCLEWGPDNWRPEVTGAMLLQSAHQLLETEFGAGATRTPVPSRHRTTLGQEVRAQVQRLVVTDRFREWLDRFPSQRQACMVTHNIYHGVADVFFVSEVQPLGGDTVVLTDVPAGVTTKFPFYSFKGAGWIFRGVRFTAAESIENLESLLTRIRDAGFEGFALPDPEEGAASRGEYLFLLLGPGALARAYLYASANGGSLRECAIIGMVSAAGQRTPSEHVGLLDKKVGIVGLGSLGSKVAVSLARSGVRKFVLIDDDLMLQGNVCRQELDWVSVGVHKADAVKQAISLVASGVDVHVRRLRIAGQESAESSSTALDALASCDLIVDATASSEVVVQLAAIAKRRQRVLVWGEIFAGGIGALLVRSRPGKDPDPLTMRSGIHNFLATQEPAPFALAATRYDIERENAPPLIATDAEVSQFASTMTRFVLDALLDRNPPEFPDSAYLIGLKRAWIFSAPFDTHPIFVNGETRECADTQAADELVQRKAVEFISELVNQRSNADSRPAE